MDEDDPTNAILESSRFWVHKVLVPVLLCIGLAGNIISVMVLTRRRMRSSTNTYLSALAIADIVHLLFNFLLSFKHYSNIHDKKYELYWRFYGLTHWLCDAASATSTWLAVSFTVERYIAVCHPMKGKVFCTERKAKSVIVIVYILCALTTASTTFEYGLTFNDECLEVCKEPIPVQQPSPQLTIDDHQLPRSSSLLAEPRTDVKEPDATTTTEDIIVNIKNNSTLALEVNTTTCCKKNFTIDVELTELGKNKSYKDFIYWYSALCFGIIPLALIATFNCFLVRAVYVSQRMRRVMTNSQDNITFTNEKRITVMLIGIVFIFLICNTPTSCWLLYYNNAPQTSRGHNIMLILGNFFNLLMMLNAPFNFLIYCLLSKKFRSTFMKIFWERKKAQQQLETETFVLSATKSMKKFNPQKHGLMKRNASEYRTPRNLETQSLTSIPRSKSLMTRPIGQARSSDLTV